MRRFAALALLIAGAGTAWLFFRSPEPPSRIDTPSASAEVDPIPKAPNVPLPSPEAKTVAPPSSAYARAWIPAPSPSMARQAEANRRSVEEARATGRFPERSSASVRPAKFDLAAFERDPQAYLDIVEPGRVYQIAEPGPSVKQLTFIGSPNVFVAEGTPAVLAVQGAPNAPVTFTAFGSLGAFDNGLTSITVRADREGRAQVIFTPAPEGAGSVRILAGSPLTSGQVPLMVGVKAEE